MSVSSYTNVDQVKAYYPAIGSASNITSATIFEYVTAVTDEIDAALAQRYTLPVSGGVPLLQTLAKRMSVFDLLTIRVMANGTMDQMKGNPFFGRLKESRDMLNAIRDGKQAIINSSGSIVSQRTDLAGVQSNTSDYQPTFHEGPWTDMIQDENKILDTLADRDLE